MDACKSPPRTPNIFDLAPTCAHDAYAFFNISIDRVPIMGKVSQIYFFAVIYILWVVNGTELHPRYRIPIRLDCSWYGAIFPIVNLLVILKQWAPALAITAFALTWGTLSKRDIKSDTAVGTLPGFEKFANSLCDASHVVAKPSEDDQNSSEVEEPTCIVCWSSDELPKVLACSHLICLDCLHSLRNSNQNQCPLCRHALFTRSDDNILTAYKAMVSLWNTDIAVRSLAVALYIYKRDSWTWTAIMDVVWVCYETMHVFYVKYTIRDTGADWWRSPIFNLFGGHRERVLWRPMCAVLILGFGVVTKMIELYSLDEELVFTTT